jgi:hypothetical protein
MSAKFVNLIAENISSSGFAYFKDFAPQGDNGARLLELIHQLGTPFIPPGKTSQFPIITTKPSAKASPSEPFNRPEQIGWHNDFATRSSRPILSLSWIAQADPALFEGGKGSWLVAGTKCVLNYIGGTPGGDKVIRFLTETPLPFAYETSDEILWANVIDKNPHNIAQIGLRFYRRALFEGCNRAYGKILPPVIVAVKSIEAAANACGILLPATTGSLLICDNWMCLHNRTEQTTENLTSSRIAYLAFIE